eukprot:TRINITY_DN1225_c0_g1_i2.p1 TRINITY_DN1225_c0_g1~~TRINITY_DN1225_c0_g1_i2.p1  ORF type:complete len:495 (+),score=54.80 TRINITY_DN1225_c0_g1_i2:889-2373(+)
MNDVYDVGFRNRICMGGSNSKPEACVHRNRRFVLAGETKGVVGSLYEALAQCFQAVADGAMLLSGDGLDLKSCVVPGLMIAGDNNVQLCACFLTVNCFPCMVLLTDSFSIHTTAGRRRLAAWFLALQEFADETDRLCLAKDVTSTNVKSIVRLDLSENTFITPVSAFVGSSLLESASNYPYRPFFIRLLETYELLFSDERCREHISFPLGWGQVPLSSVHLDLHEDIQAKWKEQFRTNGVVHRKSETPLVERQSFLLFRNLSLKDGWRMASSVRPTLRELLKEKLDSVVTTLARIVTHLDLRGNNVMVRFTFTSAGVEVEVRVIDWEHAVRHGEAVPQAILDLNLDAVCHAARISGTNVTNPIVFDQESALPWMKSCVTEIFRDHKLDVDVACRAVVSALEGFVTNLVESDESADKTITAVIASYSAAFDDEEALESWMKSAVGLGPVLNAAADRVVEEMLANLSVDEKSVREKAWDKVWEKVWEKIDILNGYC